MLNKKDLYIYKEVVPLTYTPPSSSDDPNPSLVQIGVSINKYEVRKYIDVQNLVETDCYIVNCTQRMIIPNQNVPNICNPTTESSSFEEYPALLTNQINITVPNQSDSIANYYLLQYNPRTLNANVTTDVNSSDSNGTSYSQQHTSGSTVSQTNSYGGSVNLGFFGDTSTGGLSGNYEHSSTSSQENSTSNGKTTSQDVQQANSDSMSIKDWGSYAIIDLNNQTPTWVWGQEYPWDIMKFNNLDANDNVILPTWVQERLCDGSVLYPPTQLSLFGIDFTSKASWIVQMSNILTSSSLIFNHAINYCTATHTISGDAPNCKVNATINTLPKNTQVIFQSSSIDLALLALDSMTSGVATGFTTSQFTVVPTTITWFEIASRPNNLLIRGFGFSNTMSVDFSVTNVRLDVYFKITDNAVYTLFLKCWKTADANCILAITINPIMADGAMTPNSGIQIIKNVNDSEFEGGDNNMISINLRDNDFTSAEYYDYLQYGLNHINIVITSDPNSTAAKGFQLRTLAIGKG